ncbi:MAG: hypothetical protein LUD19_05600 [Clostridia bacterium]|nr:hypothetical protein [Clostridia bacterium]
MTTCNTSCKIFLRKGLSYGKIHKKNSKVILVSAFAVCLLLMLFLPLRVYSAEIEGTKYTIWITALTAYVNNTAGRDIFIFAINTDYMLLTTTLVVTAAGIALMCFGKTYPAGIAVSCVSYLMLLFTRFVSAELVINFSIYMAYTEYTYLSPFVFIIIALMVFIAAVKGIALYSEKPVAQNEIQADICRN